MNETAWFEELYERHADYCFRLARFLLGGDREDAVLDVLQEVFITVWKKRGELMAHPNIGGWLTVTVKYRVLTMLENRKKREKRQAYSLDDEESEPLAAPQLTPEQQAELWDRMAALRELLGEKNAEMFMAYAVGGYQAKDIGRRFGLSESCVYVRISRMKKKLAAHPELFYALLLLSLGAAG